CFNAKFIPGGNVNIIGMESFVLGGVRMYWHTISGWSTIMKVDYDGTQIFFFVCQDGVVKVDQGEFSQIAFGGGFSLIVQVREERRISVAEVEACLGPIPRQTRGWPVPVTFRELADSNRRLRQDEPVAAKPTATVQSVGWGSVKNHATPAVEEQLRIMELFQ
ncbi:MAG: hypothetical protein COV79_03270, partial [Parcubacteria group bacterium CG11_big_fil_rev_8_21_14_0_20_41_14]